ncbi:MAG: hypothetical protein ACR2NZ_07215, partial [Rubripirellula sp.]
MLPTTYSTPRVGGTTTGLLVAWFIVNAFAHFRLTSADAPESASICWHIGIAMGFASIGSWMATSLENPVKRTSVRLLLALLYVVLVNHVTQSGWIRHGVDIIGLQLSQGVVFFALRIPTWESRRISGGTSKRSRYQFGIGEIIVMMTFVAVLLALARQYSSPIPGSTYWLVLTLYWIAAPLIAAGYALAGLAPRWAKGLSLLVVAWSLSGLSAAGMSMAE